MRLLTVLSLLSFAASASAAEREIRLKEGERQVFTVPGVTQVALDDASVIDVVAGQDRITVGAKKAGSSKLLVLLKNDQWVTYRVRVGQGEAASKPLPDAPPPPKKGPRAGLTVRVSGEAVLKAPAVQAVEVADDDIVEVRIVSENAVVVRGLAEGDTTVLVTRDGQVERHAVSVQY